MTYACCLSTWVSSRDLRRQGEAVQIVAAILGDVSAHP
jgi:hypothetical protein